MTVKMLKDGEIKRFCYNCRFSVKPRDMDHCLYCREHERIYFYPKEQFFEDTEEPSKPKQDWSNIDWVEILAKYNLFKNHEIKTFPKPKGNTYKWRRYSENL